MANYHEVPLSDEREGPPEHVTFKIVPLAQKLKPWEG